MTRGYLLPAEAPERFRTAIDRLVSEFGADRVRIGFERLAPGEARVIQEVGVAEDDTWQRGWSFDLRRSEGLDAFIENVKRQCAGQKDADQ